MAKCPRCGADNPDYLFYCGKCSADLRDPSGRIIEPSEERPAAPAAEKPPAADDTTTSTGLGAGSSPPRLIFCAWCGKEVNATTPYCPFCGKNPRGAWDSGSRESDYSAAQRVYVTEVPDSGASGVLVLGGVMAVLAGILALIQGLLIGTANLTASYSSYVPGYGSVCFCGGLDALFGLGSIFAGVFAFRRSNFGLALAGSVVGMLGLGFLVGSVFGLIALICIAICKQEFTD